MGQSYISMQSIKQNSYNRRTLHSLTVLVHREWKINKKGSFKIFSEMRFLYSLLPTQEYKCILFYEGAINPPPLSPQKQPTNTYIRT